MQCYDQKIESAEVWKARKKPLPEKKLETAISAVTVKENSVFLSIKSVKILSKDSFVHAQ